MTPAAVRALASVEAVVVSAMLAVLRDQQEQKPMLRRVDALRALTEQMRALRELRIK